jgi:hypothetical protein
VPLPLRRIVGSELLHAAAPREAECPCRRSVLPTCIGVEENESVRREVALGPLVRRLPSLNPSEPPEIAMFVPVRGLQSAVASVFVRLIPRASRAAISSNGDRDIPAPSARLARGRMVTFVRHVTSVRSPTAPSGASATRRPRAPRPAVN